MDDDDELNNEENVDELLDGVPKFPLTILNPRSLMMMYWNLLVYSAVLMNMNFCPFRLAFEAMQLDARKESSRTNENWGVWNSRWIYMEYGIDL